MLVMLVKGPGSKSDCVQTGRLCWHHFVGVGYIGLQTNHTVLATTHNLAFHVCLTIKHANVYLSGLYMMTLEHGNNFRITGLCLNIPEAANMNGTISSVYMKRLGHNRGKYNVTGIYINCFESDMLLQCHMIPHMALLSKCNMSISTNNN